MRTPRVRPVTVLFAMGAALLASCGQNPNPSADTVANYAGTQYAVSNAGGFSVDGCQVKIHRVTTRSSDLMPNFTLAVATCPTAQVTTTSHMCGKGCIANNMEIEPVGLAAVATPQAAAAVAPLPETVETAARLERKAHQAAQARTRRIAQLRTELARMSGELEQLESADARVQ
ncbi:hypothetical protein QZN30_04040 [Burkholderia multivorans]|nr:hypothetical protein [Burkholderia multivorans]